MGDESPLIDRASTAACPCGRATAYDGCCGPLLRNERAADTAEELMRSRYAAYALGDVDHLFRTWHPRTRPRDLTLDPTLSWVGLEVLGAHGGGPQDAEGTVSFRARWVRQGPHEETGTLAEHSRFARRAGRWVYVDGDVTDA